MSYLLNLCHSQICMFVQGFPLCRKCEQMYCTERAFILKRSKSKDLAEIGETRGELLVCSNAACYNISLKNLLGISMKVPN